MGIGLGYPYLGVKYNFSERIASEIRWATGEGINVYAGRGYWNFYSGKKLTAFTGLEGGYIKFDTLDTKGTGYEGAAFVGGEYFIYERFSFVLDFAPTFINLKSDEFKIDGIEWVTNLAVYYYFGRSVIASETKQSLTPESEVKTSRYTQPTKVGNNISVKVTDTEGNPVSQTTIKISQGETVIAKELANIKGQMSINNLPIGRYTVKAWKQGYIAEEKEVEVTATNPAELNFSLKKK